MGVRPPVRIHSKVEGEFLVRFRRLDVLADAVHLIIPWGSLVLIFGFIYLMVDRVAGTTTFADIGVKIMADIKLPQILAYGFGVGGLGYGINERRLRHKKIEHMGDHIKEIEAALDAKRSSSGLTKAGTTRPEDRI